MLGKFGKGEWLRRTFNVNESHTRLTVKFIAHAMHSWDNEKL